MKRNLFLISISFPASSKSSKKKKGKKEKKEKKSKKHKKRKHRESLNEAPIGSPLSSDPDWDSNTRGGEEKETF